MEEIKPKRMGRPPKVREELDPNTVTVPSTSTSTDSIPGHTLVGPSDTITVPTPQTEVDKLREQIEQLTKQSQEDKKMLKMLYEVADKGRILNYESQRQERKELKVNLSRYNEGYIVGWRTIKDKLVFHPTTGRAVGEEQQYEILVDRNGQIEKQLIDSYQKFSEVRYSTRVECRVVGRKEAWDGTTTFEVELPEGRVISLDARFVN